MTTIDWKPMAEFEEDAEMFPNRLVFLRVTKVQKHALADVLEDEVYTTMGNWYPTLVDNSGNVEQGHWVSVGWNWCQDEFRDCTEFEPVAWAEIPE